MLYKFILLLAIPSSLFCALDPDTWFALYDDPYVTSVEIMGHKYLVQILAHDSSCDCFDQPSYEDYDYGD